MVDYTYLSGAVLGTSAGCLLAIAFFYPYVQIHRTPIELLPLRIFQKVQVLEQALLCLGIGLAGGVFLLLLVLLQIPIPQAFCLALGVALFGLFVHGMVILVRAFR